MKRTYWKVGLVLLLLVLCFSEGNRTLVRAREIDQLELVTMLSVDVEPSDPDLLRVTTLGNKGGNESPLMMQTAKKTLTQAVSELRVLPDKKLFFGHTEQFLLGEEAAKQDLGQHLDFIGRDVSMRLDTDVYVVKGGTARDLILATTNQNRSTFDYLQNSEDAVRVDPVSYPFNAGEILQQLLMSDGSALVAAVTMETQLEPGEGGQEGGLVSQKEQENKKNQKQGGGQQGQAGEQNGGGSETGGEGSASVQIARLDGYAVFRDYSLVDYISAEDAAGVNLVLNKLNNDTVVMNGPEGGAVVLNVTRGTLKIEPKFEGGVLQSVVCAISISADINEVQGVENIMQVSVLQYVEEQLRAREVEQVENAIHKAQTLQADYLEIGKRLECTAPRQWKKIKDQWKTLFPSVPFQVEAEVKIDQTYDSNQPIERSVSWEKEAHS
jgi:spore germination protein KC